LYFFLDFITEICCYCGVFFCLFPFFSLFFWCAYVCVTVRILEISLGAFRKHSALVILYRSALCCAGMYIGLRSAVFYLSYLDNHWYTALISSFYWWIVTIHTWNQKLENLRQIFFHPYSSVHDMWNRQAKLSISNFSLSFWQFSYCTILRFLHAHFCFLIGYTLPSQALPTINFRLVISQLFSKNLCIILLFKCLEYCLFGCIRWIALMLQTQR